VCVWGWVPSRQPHALTAVRRKHSRRAITIFVNGKTQTVEIPNIEFHENRDATVIAKKNNPQGCTRFQASTGGADENCAFLGHYVASGDNSLPAFRDNLSLSWIRDP